MVSPSGHAESLVAFAIAPASSWHNSHREPRPGALFWLLAAELGPPLWRTAMEPHRWSMVDRGTEPVRVGHGPTQPRHAAWRHAGAQ